MNTSNSDRNKGYCLYKI